jgi:hypothetical protein
MQSFFGLLAGLLLQRLEDTKTAAGEISAKVARVVDAAGRGTSPTGSRAVGRDHADLSVRIGLLPLFE